jgi:hypothetical protein
MNAAITDRVHVGARVLARVTTAICQQGELGLVYEVYRSARDPKDIGISVIFEVGGYDGFSPLEQREMLMNTGESEPSMLGYQFTNVMTLCRDYANGRFKFTRS